VKGVKVKVSSGDLVAIVRKGASADRWLSISGIVNVPSVPEFPALGEGGPVLVNEAQKAEMRVRGIA
jgi:hypothetical protein